VTAQPSLANRQAAAAGSIANKAQRADEMTAFLELIAAEGVRSYLEIGVQRGLTLLSVGLTLAPGARLVGVDLPGAAWGVKDGTGPAQIEAACAQLRACGQSVEMIWGNSRAPEVVAAATERGPYDLVFIDGDHSLEGVTADCENYGPMARMFAFHDIDTPNKRGIAPDRLARYGVHTLWARIKSRYRHREIIGSQRGMGIGVLWRA